MRYNEDSEQGQLDKLLSKFLEWSDKTVVGSIAYAMVQAFLYSIGFAFGAFITLKFLGK